MTSSTVAFPGSERPKARRIPFEPFRVRLDKTREGILLDMEAATLARNEYNVALEFLDITPDTAVSISRILRG
jgi:hypothetical protein